MWDEGEATTRHLTETLYQESSGSNLATVQKLLKRLESKGCVARGSDSWPHTFSAAIAREDLIGRRLQTTADELCDGALSPLLTHLVKSRSLNRKDRSALRDLLDELDRENGGSSKKK